MTRLTVPEALERVRAKGGRVTPQKRALTELMASLDRPVSAPELCEELRREFPEMATDTVYRNLQALVALGAVEVLHIPERADRFVWVEYHHHHAVCLSCGEVVCLEPCSGDQMPPGPEGFRTVRHEYQIFGYCQRCAAAMPAAESSGRRRRSDDVSPR